MASHSTRELSKCGLGSNSVPTESSTHLNRPSRGHAEYSVTISEQEPALSADSSPGTRNVNREGFWRGVVASASSPAVSASSKSTGGPAVSEAVIVGGGLGGLATAIGLRNIGIDAQVYEARDEVIDGGTLLTLFPNGLRALSRIDPAIVPQLISRGVPDPTCFNRSPTGDILFQFDPASSITARYGFPMLCIRWQEVLDVLRGMLPNDSIHLGHRLVEFTQREEEKEGGGGAEGNGSVKCVFKEVSGGEERLMEVETPLLLGADGIHSEVRKKLLLVGGKEGQTPSARTLLGRTAAIIDGGLGKLYWALTLVDSADPTVSSARSSGGEEAREKILRAFEGWDAVEQLVKATPPDLILERRVLDLPPLPFWVHGRTALLGDAAHAVTPVTGQGANLAFEDAAQLVECLRVHSHASDALRSFQSIRMPRVQAVTSRNVAEANKLYDKKGKNEKKAGGYVKEAGYRDASKAGAAPPILKDVEATVVSAAQEARDPDDNIYGYDIVAREEELCIASVMQ
ncbi:unnamed protein product [Closterium sp. Yama58-4]|nr:unnamed protein product [Closterium sp. Yama58-4]